MTHPRSSLALVLATGGFLLSACGGPATGAVSTPLSQPAGQPAGQPGARAALEAVVAAPQRGEANRSRDTFRHPVETLTFFGLEPDMTVVEMGPGGGWYTEILAPLLRAHGQLTAAAPAPDSEYGQRFDEFLATNTELYSQVNRITFAPPDALSLGPDGSADMVLTFRSTHGWINNGVAPAVYQAMFDVLKPGGVLGVEQHRGPDGVDPTSGYVAESAVIAVAEAAGFVLEARSEINANPADDHDHPEGVWSLQPSLRGGDVDRAAYEAIGESDRMTLRFRKPAAH